MRQFISLQAPDKKGLLKISGKDYRYLRQVLRVKPGDMLAVRLPDGSLQNTTVCTVEEDTRCVVLQVCGNTADKTDSDITRGVKADEIQDSLPLVEYWLFQYIAKPVKMEQIIRQAVECGVKYIVPVRGEYSQSQNAAAMQGGKKERIERIVREARQQSGSPVSTEILEPVSTEEAVLLWKKAVESGESGRREAVVLWERNENTKSLKEILKQDEEGCGISKVAIAVGCEGGISPVEVEQLSAGGFIPIHFPGNILRCETAALYGIAAVQSALNQ